MRYRWQTGAMAWLIHRITGAAVGIYLLLHILAQFGMKYDQKGLAGLSDFLTHKVVVVTLLAFLIYHALNGVRELIVDFGNGALYHKKLFWVMMVIGVVVYVAALTAL
ncbi:MAG: succinate dehydrogenase, cytochrome b556 subunit [Deltaproteobacteria bacterium]|jgi:succinate dehydrogenase / fumarate reductase cytochrome b subunit|nr:succinate dehydrogenase, cytochrome b556 subunit [Deltaproteobacteria bacterium]